ncbi:DUF4055 domain-containing protein [Aureimonas glaciei]|nr:DUF4055 domain-containing protein [Aureimonas glaciei]
MPSGFRAQDDGGRAMYGAYMKRAQFPEILGPTVRGMVGIIHRTETQIDLPTSMLGLWEKATVDGLSLEAFHRRVTTDILLTGRYGILVDAPPEGSDMPYLAGYSAEALINWSDARDFYVLDEGGLTREGFSWTEKRKFRVLELLDGRYVVSRYSETTKDDGEVVPTKRGGGVFEEIPFVVISSRDLSVAPDEPPLIGVARAALALYRLDADYRHQLFWSGQETMVVINGDAPSAIGAGIVVSLKSGETAEGNELRPDVKYVGPAGTGIAAHRVAIQDERDNAVAAGARIFDSVQRAQESGEALRLRYAAQTATLTSIAQSSAAGLEKALRYIAIMTGANPDEVVVKPNLDFLDATMTPQDAAALVTAWQNNAISYETLYENLQRGEIASSERTAEEEFAQMQREQFEPDEVRAALLLPPAGG